MSTQICCSRFEGGAWAPLPQDALQQALDGLGIPSGAQWRVPERLGPCLFFETLGFTADERGPHSLVVGSPSGELRLYEALLQLLRHEGVVAYAPDSVAVIGNASTPLQLPAGLVASLGPARWVQSAAELREALFGSEQSGAAHRSSGDAQA